MTAQNSKRAHSSPPALQTPPKFHEKTPRERKRAKMGRRRGKKARNFVLPTLRGPTPFRAPTFVVLFFVKKKAKRLKTPIWAKIRLVKVGIGQSRSNKDGQSRIGQSWHQPPLPPFWLKPFLFKSSLLTRVDRFQFSFCSSVRRVRGLMPRRGWTAAPDGWVQIISGPRPESQKWPSAKANRQPEQVWGRCASVSERPGRWRREFQFVGQPTFVTGGIPRRSHHQDREVPAALLTLGQRISSRKAALEAALQKAQVGKPPCHLWQSRKSRQHCSSNVPRGDSEALRVGPVGPGLAFSMFKGVGRSRRTCGSSD